MHCRATATLWGIIQGNVDYSRRAASLQEASKDKLLYHVAIGSNCNKDVSMGSALSTVHCALSTLLCHLRQTDFAAGGLPACITFKCSADHSAVCW
jgi:hypothetical protein